MENKWVSIVAEDISRWIGDYMAANASPNAPIIVGLSGGKDSSVCAALCVKAVGAERVIGVRLPDASKPAMYDDDYLDAGRIAEYLGINVITFPIETRDVYAQISATLGGTANNVVRCNHPSRIRMATLYAIANQLGGRVCCTCNKSETYVGYDTAWGDQCGDFAPCQDLTASEVIQIGLAMRLPEDLVLRDPDDGMCGQTDEERWGFTYEVLDAYLDGHDQNPVVVDKIERMHERALFKISRINVPKYSYHKNGSRNLC